MLAEFVLKKQACIEVLSQPEKSSPKILADTIQVLNDKLGPYFEGDEEEGRDANWPEAISCYQIAAAYVREYAKTDEFVAAIQINLIEALLQQGHTTYQAGALDAAQVTYEEAYRLNPLHLVALNQLGMCAFKKGDYQAARIYFSIQAGPEVEKDHEVDVDAWLNLAEVMQNARKRAISKRAAQTAFQHLRGLKEEVDVSEDLKSASAWMIQHTFHQWHCNSLIGNLETHPEETYGWSRE